MLKRELLLIYTQSRKANCIYQYLVDSREMNFVLHFTQKANSENHNHFQHPEIKCVRPSFMKWMKHLSYIFTIKCTILGINCSLSNLIFSENTDSENPYTYVQNTKHLYNLLADTLPVSTDLYQLSILLDTFSKALKHICGKVI